MAEVTKRRAEVRKGFTAIFKGGVGRDVRDAMCL